ncbi:transposase InsO family protein [Brevibacterium luteolum]|nr:transposase InsO family protein [Brevibacterium luteolum]
MIRFIDTFRGRFGVEFICRVLGATACGFITSRGYRAAKSRKPAARAIRDGLLVEEVKRLHAANYGVYGVRKMWHAMRRAGWDIGRDQTARLMRVAGVTGVVRGRKPRTTVPARVPDQRPDLVMRDFKAPAPNRLWVADITYVRTSCGFVYTAFVIDAYSRRIVGWATRSSMTTEALSLEALEHALNTARGGAEQLVHHSDRGSQYVAVAYTERLADAGIRPSVGSVGDSYDNALAETVNGLYKTELIYSQPAWAGLTEVEFATMNWVHWWNTGRLHEGLGHRTPAEVEAKHFETVARQVDTLTAV